MHVFGLEALFPDIDAIYSRDSLMKLIEKRNWSLALSFVGTDEALQRILLEHLVLAGEMDRAAVLAKEQLGISDEAFSALQAKASAQLAIEADRIAVLSCTPANGYLKFPLELTSVQVCSTEAQVEEAMTYFLSEYESHGVDVVGLDVEWKPTTSRAIASSDGFNGSHSGASSFAVASILQIASSTRIFLIDLLELQVCFPIRFV